MWDASNAHDAKLAKQKQRLDPKLHEPVFTNLTKVRAPPPSCFALPCGRTSAVSRSLMPFLSPGPCPAGLPRCPGH